MLYAWFSAGTLHGFGKLYSAEKRLKHLGWYSNGMLSGTVWQFMEGGGCLVGEVGVLPTTKITIPTAKLRK